MDEAVYSCTHSRSTEKKEIIIESIKTERGMRLRCVPLLFSISPEDYSACNWISICFNILFTLSSMDFCFGLVSNLAADSR